MSSEDRSLLEAFVVNNPDLEQLEASIAQFNIFEAIGQDLPAIRAALEKVEWPDSTV